MGWWGRGGEDLKSFSLLPEVKPELMSNGRVGGTRQMRVRVGSRMLSRNKKSTCKAWWPKGAWGNMQQGSIEGHNEKKSILHEVGRWAGQTGPDLPLL